MRKIELHFKETYRADMHTPDALVQVGGDDGLLPYDMLFGALAACLHSTFLGVLKRRQCTVKAVSYTIDGEKRTEIPTVLSWITIQAKIVSNESEEILREIFEQAAAQCSIHYTLSQVAEITHELDICNEH